VVYLEHKLISDSWLQVMGGSSRPAVSFNVPDRARRGKVPATWEPLPVGRASVCAVGKDVTAISVGVGVHRCLEATAELDGDGISMGVVDLRWVSPLDRETVCAEVRRTGRALVVDEDYLSFGLSGEIAAVLLEDGVLGHPRDSFARVCTEATIPFRREWEDRVLPNTDRIMTAARKLMGP
jgi:pyruvate dehydrogenase E1 component beta subunit